MLKPILSDTLNALLQLRAASPTHRTPTFEELGERLGISHEAALLRCQQLRDLGYLAWDEGKSHIKIIYKKRTRIIGEVDEDQPVEAAAPRKPVNFIETERVKLLNAIIKWNLDNGQPPTIRELSGVLGVSRQTIVARLRRLEKLGDIEREATKSRAIKVLREHLIENGNPIVILGEVS